jgi:hypothetical protein
MITYVIIKLQSGEQVMAALEEDSTDYIDVSFPMVISATPVTDGERIHEHITAKPLCQFSADRHFRLPKSGILFYKELHEMIIPHYTKIVNSYEDTVLVKPQKPQKELNWDEPEKMSVEEIRKRIDMLSDIFGGDETEEAQEEQRVYIEGNETVH